MGLFSGPGLVPSLKGIASNLGTLSAGASFNVPSGSAGWYYINPGKYINFQARDPITGLWRGVGGSGFGAGAEYAYVDGTTNYRFVNQTGCAVGALLTAAGTGYTSTPTVVPSAGGSIWQAIVGGAVSTTVVLQNAGVNYTYPPSVVIQAPPAGGIQATAICAITAGAVSSVTITNQGAGYVSPPTIQFVNDPREGVNNITPGYNAAASLTLTGANTVTGLLCLDHGTPLAALPTLTITGGGGSGAAATAIMCWTITAYAAGTAGAGLAGSFARITAEDLFPTTASAYVNPATQANLVSTRPADIKAPITGGGITATGAVIYDGGIYTAVPAPLVIPSASVVTTAPVVTFTMGGATDQFLMQPV